jgi:hypothetical protein
MSALGLYLKFDLNEISVYSPFGLNFLISLLSQVDSGFSSFEDADESVDFLGEYFLLSPILSPPLPHLEDKCRSGSLRNICALRSLAVLSLLSVDN